MASGIGSRRRLFASEDDDDDDTGTKLCSLCGKKHCQLSLPLSWKSESAQLLVRSLQVDVESYVCRPCRDDITRLLHNPDHKPRWAMGKPPVEQHYEWLEDIRQTIWDRVQHETDMIPSSGALYRHWKRTCWVINMWSQSCQPHMVLGPLTEFGWRIEEDELLFNWDSEENIAAVRGRVEALTKGCHCKTGCNTARCSCKKNLY